MVAQQKAPKKILIHFYKDSSAFTKNIDKTYQHPLLLKQLAENYYLVKFNIHQKTPVQFNGRIFSGSSSENNPTELHSFASFMRIESYPSILFIDEKGQSITTLIGNFSPKEIEPYLLGIGTDVYKKHKTSAQWENYLKRYQSKLVD